jgi:hypothetical protein
MGVPSHFVYLLSDVAHVWEAVSQFVERQMGMQKVRTSTLHNGAAGVTYSISVARECKYLA